MASEQWTLATHEVFPPAGRMTPTWFILLLLCANGGASVVFLVQRNYAWAAIYGGAAVIQAGCLGAQR